MEIAMFIALGAVIYLLIGYIWAMAYIHHLTDGYWVNEGVYTTSRTPMGVGTAVIFTVLWPVTMIVVIILIVIALIVTLFSADLWKRLYHLR